MDAQEQADDPLFLAFPRWHRGRVVATQILPKGLRPLVRASAVKIIIGTTPSVLAGGTTHRRRLGAILPADNADIADNTSVIRVNPRYPRE